MKIGYHPSFIRQFKKLPIDLQNEVKEKIVLFQKNYGDKSLKTHKLHGKMKDQWAFSINYSWRIVFELYDNQVLFLEIGTHDLYK